MSKSRIPPPADGAGKVLARELTGWEVMRRIRGGRDIAFLTVGCTEMHGPQLPIGADTIIAEAVARLAAQRVGGTVFDSIAYSWPMATKHSFPTIAVSAEMEKQCTRAVCDQLLRVGFKRICVLQWHGPGLVLQTLAQEFFEETGVPLAVFRLMHMFYSTLYPETKDWVQRGISSEASLCAAAGRLLGINPTIDPRAGTDLKAPPPPAADAVRRIRKTGADVGTLMTHDCQHGFFRGDVDAELGLAFLGKLADLVASTASDLAAYRDAWRGISLEDSYPSAVMKRRASGAAKPRARRARR